jgi:peptide deformylase
MVTDFREAATMLDDLADTLHEFQRTHGFGRGIAGVQIGHLRRIIYIEIHGRFYELINPEVLRRSEERFELWDDCFSFPNLMVYVSRYRWVEVSYQDREGGLKSLTAQEDFAELMQHEMDHLEGVLAIDRAIDLRTSFMTRGEYLRQKSKSS